MSQDKEDLYNDDTFGEESSNLLLGNEGFSFSNLPFDSAITIVRRGKQPNKYEEELEDLPPGMSMSPPRQALTLSEIEAGLANVSLEGGQKQFRIKGRPAVITFPVDDKDEGVMTRYEREGIARIHLGQLTTEHPELEDFYYKSFAKRQSKKRNDTPLHLPTLPTPKKGREPKHGSRTNEALAGALGKAGSSSSRKPRTQLQVPSIAARILIENDFQQFSVSASIENIFEAVFTVEDALEQESDTDYDVQHLQDCRRKAIEVIRKELVLDQSNDELGTK
jgi:hypothetical protein